MNYIKSLRNFGTIYLWIFVIEVLDVCACAELYHRDTTGDAVGPVLIMKPYTYQIFDDYADELLNKRNAVATPLWQTWNKRLFNKHLPLTAAATTTNFDRTMLNNGNSMTSKEITFENLNDFDSYQTKKAIWPGKQQHQHVNVNAKDYNEINQQKQRHSLQQSMMGYNAAVAGDDSVNGGFATNIRYEQNAIQPIPIIMANLYKTKDAARTKKSKTSFNDDNTFFNDNKDENKGTNRANDVKENLFPLNVDNTFANVFDNLDEVSDDETAAINDVNDGGIANSYGNGNEILNNADNNQLNTNYMTMAESFNDVPDREHLHDKQQHYTRTNGNLLIRKVGGNKPSKKRAKPSIGHTPFLPAVSGGAMTNLGKFFRDLSKNVHVSEQYQWNSEEQKLLEGDPNFSNIHHHISKPNAATDQQTAEWIKTIRFYRPSQKIRSLVAMNPHGQWDHSSQFIDPNYMWVGLGK